MVKTYVLGILDGWGVAAPSKYNAITMAKTKYYDMMLCNHPHSLLTASGIAVGLPDGQMGNSEVGHLAIGSGRAIIQSLPRIDQAISSGELLKKLQQIKEYHTSKPHAKCHVIGLVSDGGVHSHISHIIAAWRALEGVPKVLHAITDGRDVAPRSCLKYLKELMAADVYIASISGRYYAMDRDDRWDRTDKAYEAMFLGKGKGFEVAQDYIMSSYQIDVRGDEFIIPAVNVSYHGIQVDDTILVINFRADRVRQLISTLIREQKNLPYSKIFGMTHYADEFNDYVETLFLPNDIKNTLGEVLANHSKKQLRLAETEKYAHVTYFFNGGGEQFAGEDRVMIPSPKVATYDLQPQMSIWELSKHIIDAIGSGKYDFICFNVANADMVGHTGNVDATIQAIEAIDVCLGIIYEAVMRHNAELVLTADHGNAENMYDVDAGHQHTAHTANKVPFLYIGQRRIALRDGGLIDVAPTILQLMNVPVPAEMQGHSLLCKD